jgi:hypothetical protein
MRSLQLWKDPGVQRRFVLFQFSGQYIGHFPMTELTLNGHVYQLLDDALARTHPVLIRKIAATEARERNRKAKSSVRAIFLTPSPGWNPVKDEQYVLGVNGKISSAAQAKVYVRRDWVTTWQNAAEENPGEAPEIVAAEAAAPVEGGKPNAPPLLDLKDRDLLRLPDGRVLNIEIRGERTPRGCFLKVTDISREFDARTY